MRCSPFASIVPGLLILASCTSGNGPGGKAGDKAAGDPKDPSSWQELVAAAAPQEGLFRLWTRGSDGRTYMEVAPHQLGREYILVSMVEDAPLASGHTRGHYLDNAIITFRRRHDRIEVRREVLGHWFSPDSPLHRAREANLGPALLASLKILAEGPGGTLAVSASDLFLKEGLQRLKRPTRWPASVELLDLGTLSPEKTRFHAARAYPRNLHMVVDYVYENLLSTYGGGSDIPRSASGGSDIADPRYTTLRVMHALIDTPPAGYVPRRDDPRVGFFVRRFDDRTSVSSAPWRDLIKRWRLERKDPSASLSEPVRPIVFWIENTTPHELRDTIRHAALQWNLAFEKAGFRNALEVRVQPDDAGWDAGDIDRNVLRWTSSPTPPFGGMGPCFTDPRTGEILGADVMLEWTFLARRLRVGGALGRPGETFCDLGAGLQAQALFGLAAEGDSGFGDWRPEKSRLMREAIHYLVLHEIGHTLGLSHNMKATNLHPLERLHDRALTESVGLMGSVMDYPAVNLAAPGKEQGSYFTARPGPYDLWAIEYGYRPVPDGMGEEAFLQGILARSTEPALMFGNDADDMRNPGSGIDPRVNVYDLSSDGLEHASGRLALVRESMRTLARRFLTAGSTREDLLAAYEVCIAQASASANVVSRFVGGVHVDRAREGQAGAGEPYAAVGAERQALAMAVLRREIFAPGALEPPADLARRLQPTRRDFDFRGKTENPKLLEEVHRIRCGVLDHLLHPVVLTRLSDSTRLGNTYLPSRCLEELRRAVFEDDLALAVDDGRKALQLELVSRLLAIVDPGSRTGHDAASRAAAHAALLRIDKDMARETADEPTRAHREHLRWRIRRGLEGR